MSAPEFLRDYFAAKVIDYFLKNTTAKDAVNADMEWEEMVAAQAYMLAERNSK